MSTSSEIPAVCYSTCNNAYTESQKIGKTPALCASDSLFEIDYSSCQACVAENSSDPTSTTENVLVPQFGQFLQYCASLNASSTASNVGTTATGTPPSDASSIPSSLPYFTTTFLSSTSTPSGSPYTTITAINTQSIPLYNGSTITVTLSNVITLWNQPSSTSSPSPPNSQSKLTPGHAQFNGVVVGSIFGGLSIIAFGMIYWKFWRHRHLRKSRVRAGAGDDDSPEKAQLHSDSIPTKNLVEIDGSSKRQVAELPAIDSVAEMPGSVKYSPMEVE
ncbi:putative glycoprotein x protein [Botrytis fragariae]|uniref:Putative glycoprotein x protein n=1 Tax=Botrytis fragariae TaxID=1964551 RepID=A0A8H6AWC4_9HELO|nr:putative glycoprotein x protein [Botrytis fragariae]KAF5874988.1 putative glycoprotein x protein [Botrytis fragariae]